MTKLGTRNHTCAHPVRHPGGSDPAAPERCCCRQCQGWSTWHPQEHSRPARVLARTDPAYAIGKARFRFVEASVEPCQLTSYEFSGERLTKVVREGLAVVRGAGRDTRPGVHEAKTMQPIRVWTLRSARLARLSAIQIAVKREVSTDAGRQSPSPGPCHPERGGWYRLTGLAGVQPPFSAPTPTFWGQALSEQSCSAETHRAARSAPPAPTGHDLAADQVVERAQ